MRESLCVLSHCGHRKTLMGFKTYSLLRSEHAERMNKERLTKKADGIKMEGKTTMTTKIETGGGFLKR